LNVRAECPRSTSRDSGGVAAGFVFLFARDQRQELRARRRLERLHLALVDGDVEVRDHDAALRAGFVNRRPVVRPRRELLGGEETEVQLLSPDVYLAVPLPGLLQQRNAAKLRRLRAVPSRLRAQRRHELGHGHATKRVHLAGIFPKRVVRLRRGTRFVDRRAIERARGFLLGVVVAALKKIEIRETVSRRDISQLFRCRR
jgi:hypothetical protein